jgi:cell division protein FtsW
MNHSRTRTRPLLGALRARDLKHIDFSLLFIVLSLMCLGLVSLFSASSVYAVNKGLDSLFYTKRQALWMFVGLGFTAFTAGLDLEKTRALIRPAVLLTIVLLAAVLFMHPIAHVKRWIPLGFIRLQPSEFAKLVLVLYFADFFDRKHSRITAGWGELSRPLCVMGLMLGLIALEPDLGTPVLMFGTALLLFFAAGVGPRRVFLILASALPVLAYELFFHHGYRLARLKTFLSPGTDIHGAGYQLSQSLLAVGSGGWIGKGLGASQLKLLYLPEPHTDFIFPVIAEEMGFIGSALIVLLFLALLIKGVRVARNAQSLYATMAALGLTVMIVLQAFFNMAMATGMIPTKGLPLPFFSYGGASNLATMIAVGIILNISAHRSPVR